MNTKQKIYKISLVSLSVVMFALILAMGIVAVQKSMTLKIGFNIAPSFEVKINYDGETIFCNTTKGGNEIKTSNDFTLSGNTLSFKQEFLSLGESFTFTIYNYTTKSIKISVSGTGVSGGAVVIDAYSNTAASENLTITAPAGAEAAVLTVEEVVAYSVTATGSNYDFNGNSTVIGSTSYSASFSTSEYYVLPDSIEVKVNGVTLSASEYSYTKTSDNAATLTINSVEGELEIICEATTKSVEVVVNITNISDDCVYKHTGTIFYPDTVLELDVGNEWMEVQGGGPSGTGIGYSWKWSQVVGSINVTIDWSTVGNKIEINTSGSC